MTDWATLSYLAAALTAPNVMASLVTDATDRWVEKDGYREFVTTDRDLLEELLERPVPDKCEVEVRLLEVASAYSTRLHLRRDLVAIVCGVAEVEAEAYFEIDHDWHSVREQQVVVVPKGTAYGFRASKDSESFYVLLVGTPSYTADVRYI